MPAHTHEASASPNPGESVYGVSHEADATQSSQHNFSVPLRGRDDSGRWRSRSSAVDHVAGVSSVSSEGGIEDEREDASERERES